MLRASSLAENGMVGHDCLGRVERKDLFVQVLGPSTRKSWHERRTQFVFVMMEAKVLIAKIHTS